MTCPDCHEDISAYKAHYCGTEKAEPTQLDRIEGMLKELVDRSINPELVKYDEMTSKKD
jgi:hypothetical protein